MSELSPEEKSEAAKVAAKALAVTVGLALGSAVLPLTTLAALVAWGIGRLCGSDENQ